MSTIPKLPVPTGDALMAVVADGPAVCARWRDTFLSWEPRYAVPQIVMNALDPALLELVLGPDDKNSLVRLLREYYKGVRKGFPGPFAKVEQIWRIQRAWWMQFVEADDVKATSAALAETYATLDVLLPHPAGALWLRGQRPAGRPAPRPRFAFVMPPLKRVPFAFAMPLLLKRVPFAFAMPLLKYAARLRRRRRSRTETRLSGVASHRVLTHAISPVLARRLAAAQEQTGYALATIAFGALSVGLPGYLASCSTPSPGRPPGRPKRGASIVIRVSADLYNSVVDAATTTGHSISVVVAGSIQAGLGRWRRRRRT